MNFSDALAEIKKGSLLTRTGWNGKGMFVYLMQGTEFEINRPPLKNIFPVGSKVTYRPHIDLAAPGQVCGVWQPSMGDVLAEDWEIVPEVHHQL